MRVNTYIYCEDLHNYRVIYYAQNYQRFSARSRCSDDVSIVYLWKTPRKKSHPTLRHRLKKRSVMSYVVMMTKQTSRPVLVYIQSHRLELHSYDIAVIIWKQVSRTEVPRGRNGTATLGKKHGFVWRMT